MFREKLRIGATFFEKVLRNWPKRPFRIVVWVEGKTGVRSSQQAQQASTRLRIISTCLAAAGGRVVCAADAIPPADGGLRVYHHRGLGPRYGNVENGRFADGKAIHRLTEKDRPFPQDGKPLSHSAARLGRLPTVPQRLRLLLQKSRSLIEKIIISW